MNCTTCRVQVPAGKLTCGGCGARILVLRGRNGSGHEVFENPVLGLRMVLIPGGTFRMGSEQGERDERPIHSVTLRPYLLDEVPVTAAAYAIFAGAVGAEVPQVP